MGDAKGGVGPGGAAAGDGDAAGADFSAFVLKQAERIKDHGKQMAAALGRPWEYFERAVPKEELARKIAERDGCHTVSR